MTIALIICVSILLILLLHLYATFFLSSYYGISTADIVLTITAGVIFWYSWETRQMRKEIVEQTKFQLSPFLTIDLNFESLELFVINYGEATARNIEVDCSPAIEYMGPFLKISTIYKGEKENLRIKSKNNELISTSCTLNNFQKETTFCLKYQNIFDKQYESKVVLKSSTIYLSEFKAVN
jgi:hypothetical protein